MSQAQFLKELAFELSLDPKQLTLDFPIDVASWDSLALFSTIGTIQRHYDVVVDAKQLQPCGTVGELLRMIETQV